MPSIDQIRAAFEAHCPKLVSVQGKRHASVAVVLRPNADAPETLEVLLIRRAEREGDPWSGHISFPGGRSADDDPSPRFTAERETREEVGIDLSQAAYLGRLDDLHAVGAPMVISAFAYLVRNPEIGLQGSEVREAYWIALRDLLDPETHVKYSYPQAGPDWRFPGIALSSQAEHVVWGLTYTFLEQFFGLIEHSIPSSRPWFRSLQGDAWEKWERRERGEEALVERMKAMDAKNGRKRERE